MTSPLFTFSTEASIERSRIEQELLAAEDGRSLGFGTPATATDADLRERLSDLDRIIQGPESLLVRAELWSEYRRLWGKDPQKELIATVKAHAATHYNDGGWDVIVECFTDEEIAEVIEGATSAEEALARFAPLVAVWSDRQADAINSVEGW